MADQPILPLPTARLMAAILSASLAAGAAFSAASWALGRGSPAAGLVAAGVVAGCGAAGLLAITPWRPRPIHLWISMWLGQTVVRLLVTPVVAYLLYSATSLTGLLLAVGVTYPVAVVSEAFVLRRSLPAAAR